MGLKWCLIKAVISPQTTQNGHLTMSLLSYIEPENCSQEALESILNEIKCPDILGIECSPRRRWFGLLKNTQPYLSLHGIHDMLTDDSDLNSDTWDLNQSGLDSLACFMELFAYKFGKNFTFEAIWAGDEVKNNKELTISELIQIVKSNNIETKTKYLVKSNK